MKCLKMDPGPDLKPDVLRLRMRRQHVDHAAVGHLLRRCDRLDVRQEVAEDLLAPDKSIDSISLQVLDCKLQKNQFNKVYKYSIVNYKRISSIKFTSTRL
jgi:hypothetical protein